MISRARARAWAQERGEAAFGQRSHIHLVQYIGRASRSRQQWGAKPAPVGFTECGDKRLAMLLTDEERFKLSLKYFVYLVGVRGHRFTVWGGIPAHLRSCKPSRGNDALFPLSHKRRSTGRKPVSLF